MASKLIWTDEDKFDFDEYTINVAREAGLNVKRFEKKGS